MVLTSKDGNQKSLDMRGFGKYNKGVGW